MKRVAWEDYLKDIKGYHAASGICGAVAGRIQ
jgi:hypothetical protein